MSKTEEERLEELRGIGRREGKHFLEMMYRMYTPRDPLTARVIAEFEAEERAAWAKTPEGLQTRATEAAERQAAEAGRATRIAFGALLVSMLALLVAVAAYWRS